MNEAVRRRLFCIFYVRYVLKGSKLSQIVDLFGAPSGTRTRVFAVKGRRPGPLDDGRKACEPLTPGGSGARHCYRGACSRAQGVRTRRPRRVESPRRLKRRPNSRLPLQRTEWSLTGGTSADAAETSAPPKSNSMKIASEMLSLCGPSMPSTLASVTHECAPCSLLSRLSPLLFACSGRIVSLLDSLSDSRRFASNNWKSNTLGEKTSRNAGDFPG